MLAKGASGVPNLLGWSLQNPAPPRRLRGAQMNAKPNSSPPPRTSTTPPSNPCPLAQGLHRRLARGHPRADARDRAVNTPAAFGAEANPPVHVYDTSGPYTDPDADRHPLGLHRCASDDRGARRHRAPRRPNLPLRERAPADPKLAELRFDLKRTPAPREGRRQRLADALRAPRAGNAGDGVRRHPREPAPRRIPEELARSAPARRQALCTS